MNKRYIDFVPMDRRGAAMPISMAAKKPVAKKPVARKPVAKKPEKPATPIIKRAQPTVTFSRNASAPKETEEVLVEEMFVEKAQPAGVSTGLKTAKFGVIEDYHPKFVQTEVKKRPLGAKPAVKPASAKPAPVKITSSRITSTRPVVSTKPASSSRGTVNKDAAFKAAALKAGNVVKTGAKKSSLKFPTSPRTVQANFINVGKVEKRPLSKNVYARKTPDLEISEQKEKEGSKKPVVIIAKPEKDSKVGLIVAVILTIILGAAAGTVAFLLLPK